MELFTKLQGLSLVNMVRQAKIYPFFRTLEGTVGNNVTHNGKELVMMSSNNYLGLTHDPRVIEASVEAVRYWGTGCTGSRFLNGNLALHEKLEAKLAEFVGTEAALVFASGFLANLGTIPALAGKGDYIFSDGDNHACIIEGCKASDAKTLVYRHNDMAHLEDLLKSVPADAGKLIITDGVFSMTGKTAKYDQIYALAQKYGARTYIDDAHGIGVVGDGGRGTANKFKLPCDVIMGTFSKSLASQGGFIAGSAEMIDWLRHQARSFIFSAALAPASTAAACKALEVLMMEPQRVQKAAANAEYFKVGLKNLGLNTMGSPTTIIPIMIGDDSICLGVCETLLKLGIFTTPVVYPAVPRGQALIRCSVMPTHTNKDLDIAIQAFAQVAPAILAANAKPNDRALYEEMTKPGDLPVAASQLN